MPLLPVQSKPHRAEVDNLEASGKLSSERDMFRSLLADVKS